MILLFIRSSETTVNHFQEYMRTGDLKSMAEDAHKIASSCRQIGAQTLYNLIKKLEEIAKQRDETRSLPEVIQAVASETERVNTFLKKYLSKLDT
jgi:HPt (histidine-containing phosphotransfer) domain-containing protein